MEYGTNSIVSVYPYSKKQKLLTKRKSWMFSLEGCSRLLLVLRRQSWRPKKKYI
jgi:hypothetical protein